VISNPTTGGLDHRWRDAISIYGRREVAVLGLLGFSAGLPYLLVFSTLSVWLRESGIALSTIGFVSMLSLTYSIKVLWAPVIDSIRLAGPLRRLGARRSWMLLAQCLIAVSLTGLASTDPTVSLLPVVLCAFALAFGSATQDIVIDAYRIEVAAVEQQAALSAAYIFGYRLALLVGGAGALFIAEYASWSIAYLSMAACMLVGVITTLCIREPERPLGRARTAGGKPRSFVTWIREAVLDPFREFFRRNGSALALLVLLLIAVYRLSDITMGVMANPFYLDLGFTKAQIASIAKVFGFGMTIVGSLVGGMLVVRYGLRAMLLVGATLVALTNLAFASLSWWGEASVPLLALVISADNFSGGMANVVFIAFLSSLTHRTYTATQYALFSSLMTSLGGLFGGFSGLVVEGFGYTTFFIYAALLGVPAMLLVVLLGRRAADLMAPRDVSSTPVLP
jgi:MFS transporter, PAT family, beta-lactamase induction signal transducer AmpG